MNDPEKQITASELSRTGKTKVYKNRIATLTQSF